MAEYIDKEAFIEDIKTEILNLSMDGLKGTRMPHDELYQFIERIKEQPTADVMEVVRCQNCAYSHKGCDSDMTKEIWCTYWQKTEGKAWNMMHFDDFCSHGAKMDLKDLEESK